MGRKLILATGGFGFVDSNVVHWKAGNKPGAQVIVFDKLAYAGTLGDLADIPEDRIGFARDDICGVVLLDELFRRVDAAARLNDSDSANRRYSLRDALIDDYTVR